MAKKRPVHEKQKKKNYAIFLAIIAFVITVFFVSVIRMKGP
jgi:hypothetical protein